MSKLGIFTDNMNTIQIFNSLSALPAYNKILKSSVDYLLSDINNPIDLQVIHIAGKLNVVADALSRGNLHTANAIAPGIVVENFSPPRF